jgi:hypothetical protein
MTSERAGVTGGARLGRAEAIEDFSRILWRMNRGENAHLAAALIALQYIDGKNAFHEVGPRVVGAGDVALIPIAASPIALSGGSAVA